MVWMALVGVVCVVGSRQITGAGGAGAADVLRAVVGPAATARLEASYLTLADTLHAATYALGGQPVHAPWAGSPPAVTRPPVPGALAHGAVSQAQVASARSGQGSGPVPLLLPPLRVVITPALAGEGRWTTAGLPPAGRSALPPVAKTFLRPDPARPYALATLLQVDLRVARLHIVAGTEQPGGPIGRPGAGLIPPADTQGDRLLAVFNGGFKYADGAYGLMSGGTVYVRPVWGAATLAVTRRGSVLLGAWGRDARLSGANRALIAWRQNARLLLDQGRITAQTQEGDTWGLSIMNSVYTGRSGIGLTAQGTLLYVAGASLSATTLAQTLQAAGAVTAMELDINPYWVRSFTYGRDAHGQLTAWALDPAMPGIGMEYLYGYTRDFFYVTRSR